MSDSQPGCDTYTQTPNCFYDRLLGEINSLSEMKVTLTLIRKIYGWHKEDDSDGDLISFSQFIEITKLSRPMVKQGLDAGVKRGSIIQVAHGQSFKYRLNLADYQGEAPESKRGSKLAEARKVRALNRSIELTSLDNTPVSGLENKPATGLDNKHTKETELNKDLNKSVVVIASPSPDRKEKAITTTTRPGAVKSEAVLIEEYFLLATTGSTGFMSSMQREFIKDLTNKGFTLERCKPGIDQTLAEMNGKQKTVGSFKLCIPAIIQLDQARSRPVPIQNYQKPIPFEQAKREFREDDQRLTPLQQQLHDQKLAAYRREKAEEEQRRLQRIAQKQTLTAQVAVLQA